jgi:hypothetical protein
MPGGFFEKELNMKRIIIAVLLATGSLVSASSFAAAPNTTQGETLNDSFHYPAY